MLQFFLEHLFKLFKFGPYNNRAIGYAVTVVRIIILVVIFCRIELVKLCYFGHYWIIKCTALIQFGLIFFRFLFLPCIMIKNCASVLCALVCSLPVKCGG